jgi:hypothetical protein
MMGRGRFGFVCGVLVVGLSALGCGSTSTTTTKAAATTTPTTTGTASAAPSSASSASVTSESTQPTQSQPASRYRHCDVNITARIGTTTCAFAVNAFYDYYVQRRPMQMRVWSPAAGEMLLTRCSGTDTIVCRTADSGAAEFSRAAVDGYSDALAKAYAAHHYLGPTTQASSRTLPSGQPKANKRTRVCYPSVDLPAVTLPATTLPSVNLPAVQVGGIHYPAQHYPAQHYPSEHYPAQHIPGSCFEVSGAFALDKTSLLPADTYRTIDPTYSAALTTRYWSSAGSSVNDPDANAAGFGQLNAAGFPKNQYVRPYVRQDGTFVSGYWRNSPADGLPTCQVISC